MTSTPEPDDLLAFALLISVTLAATLVGIRLVDRLMGRDEEKGMVR